jgi:hypothetical protein
LRYNSILIDEFNPAFTMPDSDVTITAVLESTPVAGLFVMGSGGVRTIDLASDGSLFTVMDKVTLVLGDKLVLRGRSNNTAALVGIGVVSNDPSLRTGNGHHMRSVFIAH